MTREGDSPITLSRKDLGEISREPYFREIPRFLGRRFDVGIQAKEVRWVVVLLQSRQAGVVAAVSRASIDVIPIGGGKVHVITAYMRS